MNRVRHDWPLVQRPESGSVAGDNEVKTENERYDLAMFRRLNADNARRLEEFKARLGPRLITHPQYRPDPRHSLVPEIWQMARAPWWEQAHFEAEKARLANPQYHRAQAILRTTIKTLKGV